MSDPAPSAPVAFGPADQDICDRAWNPYGDLPATCDHACVMPPSAECTGSAPCIDRPACKLAVARPENPRVDCPATFDAGGGVIGCCVDVSWGTGHAEVFYACP